MYKLSILLKDAARNATLPMEPINAIEVKERSYGLTFSAKHRPSDSYYTKYIIPWDQIAAVNISPKDVDVNINITEGD